MKNLKGKAITFNDWRRIAKRFGSEEAVELITAYQELVFCKDNDEVNKSEAFLFNIITGCPTSGSVNGL